jgi:uncharacterized protein YbgA (DUF1722 family)/uncharacterized protein YbbK (DUF523 family)
VVDVQVKPKIVVSKCIEFASCRWNGLTISSEVVKKLKPFVDFQPVCAEVEIELGIPRKPLRLVKSNDDIHMMQSETEADVTDRMEKFASSFVDSLDEVDGFILKGRSPSCGMKDVKLYPSLGKVAALKGKTSGLFAREIMRQYPHLALEDEGRLTNFTIREHFLTRIFALARLRKLMKDPTMHSLVDFQARNKFLLLSYNQSRMRILGKVVANHEKKPMQEVVSEYTKHFIDAFAKQPRYTTNVNVLTHALGYFSDSLSKGEKAFFMEALDKYQDKKMPLSVPLNIIKSFIVRFGNEYLADQTYFNPYPEELMDIKDSGMGKDY